MRPDLNSLENFLWAEKLRVGENYLNELRRRLNIEVKRFYIGFDIASRINMLQVLSS